MNSQHATENEVTVHMVKSPTIEDPRDAHPTSHRSERGIMSRPIAENASAVNLVTTTNSFPTNTQTVEHAQGG